MSAAQNQSSLESQLGALQCHFTWSLLKDSRSRLPRLLKQLEDIGTEEGTPWLGHSYNLQGFTQWALGSAQDACTLFSRAAETLERDPWFTEPWLLVNYSNLAWLRHHQGEPEESRAYLAKVSALMEQHPPPSQDQLHPEVNAEKAWTLMKFGEERKQEAEESFQSAIHRRPDMVEWNTSYVLLKVRAFKFRPLDDELLDKLREATRLDPGNQYLSIQYLYDRSKRREDGEDVEDEVRELAEKVLENPISSYSGWKSVLRIYRDYGLYNEAIGLADEALRRHPDQRYLKMCAALCYKWKIFSFKERRPEQRLIERAIRLHQEVIKLYSQALSKRINLADVKARSPEYLDQAEELYQELLLQTDLEPAGKQMVYNRYAKFLFSHRQNREESIRYHMKAAEIPCKSFFRDDSNNTLKRIVEQGRNRLCGEIQEFLRNLDD
ncbi:interferon-induced protein with tetratricopeptide repeats 2-like [Nelusetta ayraudi]|uniref:interferon-induced protein with tetratricopeptide repeats 2-like n=1 Tax=Nelusetta ayraudi TaxID=303726 RepID=UPI003F70C54A